MKPEEIRINIIGAGISGLIAALVLEEHGFSPHLFEASDRVGGRLKTDIVNNYQLDHGFQVLLDYYPYAKKYLNYDRLELSKLLPAAAIINSSYSLFGDPMRDFSLLFPIIFSSQASLRDKIKVIQLRKDLKRKDLEQLFESEERSTSDYLTKMGFSNRIINSFFRPFYSGIFLENELNTSSRMFEFVFKCFSEGNACIPKGGIEAIPKQLVKNLTRTKIHYNVRINEVRDGNIVIAGVDSIESDYTIIATEADNLINNLRGQSISWNRCDCLYFETKDRLIKKPIIGLIPNQSAYVNNFFYHTSLPVNRKGEGELLSVTVVKEHDLGEEELVKTVEQELKVIAGIEVNHYIKGYKIQKALPKLHQLKYDLPHSQTQLTESVFLAGDQLLNGSLNAAMISGERASQGVIESLGGRRQ